MVYDPYVRGEIHGLRMTSLDELLTRSGAITLHARLTPEPRGLIGARELSLLPPGAMVVNAARGPRSATVSSSPRIWAARAVRWPKRRRRRQRRR